MNTLRSALLAAVAGGSALLLFATLALAAPPTKYSSDQVVGSVFDGTERVYFSSFESNSSRSVFFYHYSLSSGTYLCYCFGDPGSDGTEVNGSAKKGSATVDAADIANLNCLYGSPSNASIDCQTDGTDEYSSVGRQTYKTSDGTTNFHGWHKRSAADCTITLDGNSWSSNTNNGDFGRITKSASH